MITQLIAVALMVPQAGLDGQITSVTAPTRIKPGQKVRIVLDVRNTGSVNFEKTAHFATVRVQRSPSGSAAQIEDLELDIPIDFETTRSGKVDGFITGVEYEGDYTMIAALRTKRGETFGTHRTFQMKISDQYHGDVRRINLASKGKPGKTENFSVEVKNTGHQTWLKGLYELQVTMTAVEKGGSKSEGLKSFNFKVASTRDVKPGTSTFLGKKITLPKTPGIYEVSVGFYDKQDRVLMHRVEKKKITIAK
jgi:hypothetical protein